MPKIKIGQISVKLFNNTDLYIFTSIISAILPTAHKIKKIHIFLNAHEML